MILIKSILVATDFSEPSDAALTYGREMALVFSAKLHVVHVTENVMATVAADYWGATFPELQGRVDDDARKRLEEMLTLQDREKFSAAAVVRSSSDAATAIVEYAKQEMIDLIVIGTRGLNGISRVLVGSVAERVVRTATCPVLAVHGREHESLIGGAPVTDAVG